MAYNGISPLPLLYPICKRGHAWNDMANVKADLRGEGVGGSGRKQSSPGTVGGNRASYSQRPNCHVWSMAYLTSLESCVQETRCFAQMSVVAATLSVLNPTVSLFKSFVIQPRKTVSFLGEDIGNTFKIGSK